MLQHYIRPSAAVVPPWVYFFPLTQSGREKSQLLLRHRVRYPGALILPAALLLTAAVIEVAATSAAVAAAAVTGFMLSLLFLFSVLVGTRCEE